MTYDSKQELIKEIENKVTPQQIKKEYERFLCPNKEYSPKALFDSYIDIKYLEYIKQKVKKKEKLSKEELTFIFETEHIINSFDWQSYIYISNEIKKIKEKVCNRQNYALAFGIKEEEVALNFNEWNLNKDKIKLAVFDFNLDILDDGKGLKLPEVVMGNVYLDGLTSAKGVVLPKKLYGNLNLNGITSVKDLELPKLILGSVSLKSLETIEGLDLPKDFPIDLIIYKNSSSILL